MCDLAGIFVLFLIRGNTLTAMENEMKRYNVTDYTLLKAREPAPGITRNMLL